MKERSLFGRGINTKPSLFENLPKDYSDFLESIYKNCSPDALKEQKKDEKYVRKLDWDGKFLWQFCISEKSKELYEFLDNTKGYPAEKTVNKIGSNGLDQEKVKLLIKATINVNGYKSLCDFIDAYIIFCRDREEPKNAKAFEENKSLVDKVIAAHTLISSNPPDENAGNTALPSKTDEVRASNPYKGLEPFKNKDKKYFFGRDNEIKELCASIKQSPLTVVTGASGCGKSSLVLAGVVPKLLESKNWIDLDFRFSDSSDDPFKALSRAIIARTSDKKPDTSEINKKADALKKRETSLIDELDAVRNNENSDNKKKVLIVIDQFEELYTRGIDEILIEQFLSLLVTAFETLETNHNASIVLTIRRDFLDHVEKCPNFTRLVNKNTSNIGFLSDEGLSEAIRKPAEIGGVEFEERLEEKIISDANVSIRNLPLIEFALTELWEQQKNGFITHEAYNNIGGIYGALSQRADNFYNNLTNEDKKLVKDVFIRLVNPGEHGSPNTKRLRQKSEFDFNKELWPVIQGMADESHRLVIVDQQGEEDTVEIAHDKLITEWPRLSDWLKENYSFLIWQKKIQDRVLKWIKYQENSDYLLRGRELEEALQQVRHGSLTNEEMTFIVASEQEYKKILRHKKIIKITSVISLLVFIFLSAFLYVSRNQVEEEKVKAMVNAGRLVSLIANDFSEKGENRLATLLALKAVSTADDYGHEDYRKQAIDTLHRLRGRYIEIKRISIPDNITSFIFSKNKKNFITGSSDGHITIWDTKTGKKTKAFPQASSGVMSIKLQNDDNILIAFLSNGYMAAFDQSSGEILDEIRVGGYDSTSKTPLFLDNMMSKASYNIESEKIKIKKGNKDFLEENDRDTYSSIKDRIQTKIGKYSSIDYLDFHDNWVLLRLANGFWRAAEIDNEKKVINHFPVNLNGASFVSMDDYRIFFDKEEGYKVSLSGKVHYELDINSGELRKNHFRESLNYIANVEDSALELDYFWRKGVHSGYSKLPFLFFLDIGFDNPYQEESMVDINGNTIGIVESGMLRVYEKAEYPDFFNTIYAINKEKNLYAVSGDLRLTFIASQKFIEMRDTLSGKRLAIMYANPLYGQINDISVDYDGLNVLIAHKEGNIVSWNTRTGVQKKVFSVEGRALEVCFSNDYSHIFAVGQRSHAGTFEFYEKNLINDSDVKNHYVNNAFENTVFNLSSNYSLLMNIKTDQNSTTLAPFKLRSGRDTYIAEVRHVYSKVKWKVSFKNTEDKIHEIFFPGDLKWVSFDPSEKFLLLRSEKAVHIYNVESGELFRRFQFSDEIRIVQSLFSRDSKNLIFNLDRRKIQVFDLYKENLVFDYTISSDDNLSLLGSSLDSNLIAWKEGTSRAIVSPIEMFNEGGIDEFFSSFKIPPIEKGEVDDLLFDYLSE